MQTILSNTARVPDPVTFHAEPDSNSSIYVTWNQTTTNTDPLLLRYEVEISGPVVPLTVSCPQDPQTNTPLLVEELLYDARNLTIRGLQANTMYEVVVTASTSSEESEGREVVVSTFPNGKSKL